MLKRLDWEFIGYMALLWVAALLLAFFLLPEKTVNGSIALVVFAVALPLLGVLGNYLLVWIESKWHVSEHRKIMFGIIAVTAGLALIGAAWAAIT